MYKSIRGNSKVHSESSGLVYRFRSNQYNEADTLGFRFILKRKEG